MFLPSVGARAASTNVESFLGFPIPSVFDSLFPVILDGRLIWVGFMVLICVSRRV